ncbi:MAG TPA: UpxY family transcription antiterminator [Edaphocola sp.]|nr:UpxY family transcription antiterminator [Edaphocola sp.]
MKCWYVLYVKSRAEKKVAERLQQEGWEVFCPLKTEWRQWSDRRKKVEAPYFRSYVFARFSFKEERLALLQTPGVVRVLFWLGLPAVIRDEEMEEIRAFFEKYRDSGIVTEELEVGTEYRVKEGVMEGKAGIVVWQNAERAVLAISGMNVRLSVRKNHLDKQKVGL